LLPALDVSLAALLAIVAIAGVARGLSGFGTGMIVAPVAGALYGPQAALAIIVIIDSLPTIPVTIPAMKIARWREVLPVLGGIAVFLPLGVLLLKSGDPVVLRWIISIAILGCAAVLWRGWRYHGSRNAGVSFGVGSVAGVLSGIASIPGPPVIFYWLSSDMPAAIVRANLLTLFLLGEVLSIGNLWFAGLFTRDVVMLGLISAPVYFAGLLLGSRLHRGTSETAYRRITFGLVVLSALLALPLTTSVLAMLAG